MPSPECGYQPGLNEIKEAEEMLDDKSFANNPETSGVTRLRELTQVREEALDKKYPQNIELSLNMGQFTEGDIRSIGSRDKFDQCLVRIAGNMFGILLPADVSKKFSTGENVKIVFDSKDPANRKPIGVIAGDRLVWDSNEN